MEQNKREEIVNQIKITCEKVGININEIEIDFSTKTVCYFGHVSIDDCVVIRNKTDNIEVRVGGDTIAENIAKCAIETYQKEKNRFIEEKNLKYEQDKYKKEIEKELAYKEEHPFLSLFKRW